MNNENNNPVNNVPAMPQAPITPQPAVATPSMPAMPQAPVNPQASTIQPAMPMMATMPVSPSTGAPTNPTTSVQTPVAPNTVVNPTPASSPTPTQVVENGAKTDSVTYDYNALYGNNNQAEQASTTTVDTTTNDTNSIVFEEPLNIKVAELPKAPDTTVIPEFNINALDTNHDDQSTIKRLDNQPTINFVNTQAEQKKSTDKSNTIFIIVVLAIIFVSVLVIFPFLARH